MNKIALSDVIIKSPGVQIREKILEKYDSIKNFADAIDLYESSINQYLSSKSLGSSTFKIRTINALKTEFDDLFKTDEEQIRDLTSKVSWYIDEYNLEKDILIFEKLKKIVLERELMEDYAIVCRCYAHYYMNIGLYDRAYAYIDVAVNTMRDKAFKDRFGLYLSDLISMKVTTLNKGVLKKLMDEVLAVIKEVKGPLTKLKIYMNIADAYFKLSEYKLSEDYYNKAFKYVDNDKSKSLLYVSLGNVEKAKSNYDSAFKYYTSAENLLVEDDSIMKYIYDEFALYYYEKDMLDEAENYIDKVFLSEGYDISYSNNTRLDTYFKIKLKLNKEDDLLFIIERLINEIKLGYIYGVSQLEKLDEILESSITSEYLNKKITKLIKNYYKTNDLKEKYSKALKQILGTLSLKD